MITIIDSVAEWSKALASGASPNGRGFESHRCHSYFAQYKTKRAGRKIICIIRESNPGHVDGNDVFYH